jgi:hypothetical protein
MHTDVQAVITELDGHRVRFEQFCRALSGDELERPVPQSTWIVRDFIAHLGTIDGPVERMFRSIREGKRGTFDENGGSRWDVDQWNEEMVRARRRMSIDELFEEAATTRESIRNEMARLGQDELDFVMAFGGDSKRPAGKVQLLQYLRGWCKHDPMHVVDMLRGIPGRRTPEIAAWLNDPVIDGYQKAMNAPKA